MSMDENEHSLAEIGREKLYCIPLRIYCSFRKIKNNNAQNAEWTTFEDFCISIFYQSMIVHVPLS